MLRRAFRWAMLPITCFASLLESTQGLETKSIILILDLNYFISR